MKRVTYTLFILLASFKSFSQEGGKGGLVGGLSTSFIHRNGNYEIGKQYDAALGGFGGYQRSFSIGKYRFSGEALLGYSRVKYHNDQVATDGAGSPIGQLKWVDRRLDLLLGMLYNHPLKKLKLAVGVQLKGNVFNETAGKSSLVTVKVTQISGRRFDLSIPVEVSYSLGNSELLLRYERGLVNRLNTSQNDLKEFDNTLRLGARFMFNASE